MLYMLVRLYLSYSLFVWVGLCITLAVFYIRIKVIIMHITLHIGRYAAAELFTMDT